MAIHRGAWKNQNMKREALKLKIFLCDIHVSAVQNCVTLLRQGRPAPHREARQKRRELRLKQQAEQEELELRMRELQTANEAKQHELENMRKVGDGTHTVNSPPWIQSGQKKSASLSLLFRSISTMKMNRSDRCRDCQKYNR